MRQNPARRAALLDAAIEVLARDGARGLTFRAVDAQAQVPGGTASNYFASRDEMLTQAGARVYERLEPEAGSLTGSPEEHKDRARVAELTHEVVERVSTYRTGFLALLELRLEATRRPALRAVLTERIRADVDANIRLHLGDGRPGDATSVELLHLAMNWLILERLTLPDVFPEARLRELVEQAVERLVPERRDEVPAEG
ncbi:TetR family transcriptional regulator [Microbispora triticiradicis]|uniref:TetR family transcriptional regulator n=1 Tax=Microbispora triticiradicis TaxID=2200763 RepID=A0ABX9LFL3_9ACTN|nr:TetR/AcrR family transcriptional regulator [Microbispora triticiradicis]RGA02768.1 TetR family transcriptional regulator [Microbispora triticiradicis]